MSEIIALKPFHTLHLTTMSSFTSNFPASRIQKGLVLRHGNRDLSEEGVGFGVPVLKFGQETIFPGSWRARVKRHNGYTSVEADFVLNLAIRMSRNGKLIGNKGFYKTKEKLSFLHRNLPLLRRGLSFSSELLRGAFSLEDVFVEVKPIRFVKAFYKIKNCKILVELKFSRSAGCTEVIVLNEQGANYFDTYRDSECRILKRDKIGSWDETDADAASFINPADRISFTLKRAKGARLFRGRELTSGRLAWSGLAYVLSPQIERFTYSIDIGMGIGMDMGIDAGRTQTDTGLT
jgi:hypothetical protein